MREALGIVIGLEAQPAARIIRQRLRAVGARSIPVGPHTATRKRPFGLTRRECEVLDLICVEQTNAEIAAKLFISAKTVDHHVSAILAKLGVPTPTAARRAVRLRRAGDARWLIWIEVAYRDQEQPEVAYLGQQSVQGGLIGDRACDDGVLPVAADLEVLEPGGPPPVEDALTRIS